MLKVQRVDQKFSIGSQPSEHELGQLAGQGFKSIINLRVPNEDSEQLPPEEEGSQARELGMEYLHIPIAGQQIRPEQADMFRTAAASLPGPMFVHCAAGKRAMGFVMIDKALREGWNSQQAIDQAKELGTPLDSPPIHDFVVQYIDDHDEVDSQR